MSTGKLVNVSGSLSQKGIQHNIVHINYIKVVWTLLDTHLKNLTQIITEVYITSMNFGLDEKPRVVKLRGIY